MDGDKTITIGIDPKDIKSVQQGVQVLDSLGISADKVARDFNKMEKSVIEAVAALAKTEIGKPFTTLTKDVNESTAAIDHLNKVSKEAARLSSKAFKSGLTSQITDAKALLKLEQHLNSEIEKQAVLKAKLDILSSTKKSSALAIEIKRAEKVTWELEKQVMLREKLRASSGVMRTSVDIDKDVLARINAAQQSLSKLSVSPKFQKEVDELTKDFGHLNTEILKGTKIDRGKIIAALEAQHNKVKKLSVAYTSANKQQERLNAVIAKAKVDTWAKRYARDLAYLDSQLKKTTTSQSAAVDKLKSRLNSLKSVDLPDEEITRMKIAIRDMNRELRKTGTTDLNKLGRLSAQIKKLESNTKRVTKETKKLTQAQKLQHSVTRGLAGGVGKLWLSYGQGAAAIATMGVAYAAASTAAKKFRETIEFDYLTRYSTAIEGTGASLEGLQKEILAIENVASAPVELAGGLRELVKAGIETDQIFGEGLLKTLSKFATVAEVDVAKSVQLAVTQVNAFSKVTQESAGYILDYKTATEQMAAAVFSAPISFGDLTQSLKHTTELAVTVRASFDEILTGLALMGKAGIKGSQAGTAMRTSLLKLVTPTKDLERVFGALGVNIADAFDELGNIDVKKGLGLFKEVFLQLDEISKVKFAKDVFGLRAQKVMAVIANLDKWDEQNKKIIESTGSIEDAYDDISESLKTAGEEFSAAFSREVIEELIPIIEGLVPALKKLTRNMDQVVETMKTMLKVVGSLIAFLGAGKLISVTMNAAKSFKSLSIGLGLASAEAGIFAASLRLLPPLMALVAGYEIGKKLNEFVSSLGVDKAVDLVGDLKAEFNALDKQLQSSREKFESMTPGTKMYEFTKMEFEGLELLMEEFFDKVDGYAGKDVLPDNMVRNINEAREAIYPLEEAMASYAKTAEVASGKMTPAVNTAGLEEATYYMNAFVKMRFAVASFLKDDMWEKGLALSLNIDLPIEKLGEFSSAAIKGFSGSKDAADGYNDALEDLRIKSEAYSEASITERSGQTGAAYFRSLENAAKAYVKVLEEIAGRQDEIRGIERDFGNQLRELGRESMSGMDARKDVLDEIHEKERMAKALSEEIRGIDQSTAEGKIKYNSLIEEQNGLLEEAKSLVQGLGTEAIKADAALVAMAKSDLESAKDKLKGRNIQENRDAVRDAGKYYEYLTDSVGGVVKAKKELYEAEKALKKHNVSSKREAYKQAKDNYELVKALDDAGAATDKLSVAKARLAYAEKKSEFKGRDRFKEAHEARKLVKAERELAKLAEQMERTGRKGDIDRYRDSLASYEKLYNAQKSGVAESLSKQEAIKQKEEEIRRIAEQIIEVKKEQLDVVQKKLGDTDIAQETLNKNTESYGVIWDANTKEVLAFEQTASGVFSRISKQQQELNNSAEGFYLGKSGAITNIKPEDLPKNVQIKDDIIPAEIIAGAERDMNKVKDIVEETYTKVGDSLYTYGDKLDDNLLKTISWADNEVININKVTLALKALNATADDYDLKQTSIAGAKALGGPVIGGSTYLVGEKGPELFTPQSSGTITPNNKMQKPTETIALDLTINGQQLPTLPVSSRTAVDDFVDKLEQAQRTMS
jgi:TP901 family phage tail tape measure protein